MKDAIADYKNKNRLVLCDFDKTLIDCDSLITILIFEKWYLDYSLIKAGIMIIFSKFIKSDEMPSRSYFKYILLRKYQVLPLKKKEKYVQYLKEHLDCRVIEMINRIHPDKIVVASASDINLIREILENVIDIDKIIANEFIDDSDEFVTCYGQEKACRFLEQFPDSDRYDITVFSDSLSDAPIYNLASKRYLVRKDSIKIL